MSGTMSNALSFRRGDENRPQRCGFRAVRRMVRTHPGSLSEGAGSPQGLTEGVSSDGCLGQVFYSQFFIGSEIFKWLRSSKYTPSVSLRSTAPSEREPGNVLP